MIYLYVCVYICLYVCMSMYICLYVYMYICLYVYIYIYISRCSYVYMSIYICIYTYIYIDVCASVSKCMCIRIPLAGWETLEDSARNVRPEEKLERDVSKLRAKFEKDLSKEHDHQVTG